MPSNAKSITMDAVYTAPGYLFRRMQQIAVALFVEECKSFDLTPVQYAALIAIHTHPGIDATRLSAVIAFDRSTPGNVIERLEAKKLIDRKPSPDDKRVKLLYLTKGGAALLRDIAASVDRAQARILQPLKPADRKTLMALLSQLVDLNNEASRVPLRAEDALEHLGGRGDGGAVEGGQRRVFAPCPPSRRQRRCYGGDALLWPPYDSMTLAMTLHPHHGLAVDLAGAGFWQLVDEQDLARIFVRQQLRLDEILQPPLRVALVGRALVHHHDGLQGHAAVGKLGGIDGAFTHFRMRGQAQLDFEWIDPLP